MLTKRTAARNRTQQQIAIRNISNSMSQQKLLPPSIVAAGSPTTMHDSSSAPPAKSFVLVASTIYVLSGVTQPMIMTLIKDAGLGDPSCQLYMLFYYLGPAFVGLTLFNARWPSPRTLLKGGSISVIDFFSQAANYTGAALAGPTLFAIIYSSVTVWAALFSRLVLSRNMNLWQWIGVISVFSGLAITALHAVNLGPLVFHGALLVTAGSATHAFVYVLNEAIMTRGEEKLPVRMNCLIQTIIATFAFGFWQIVYTRNHFTELIKEPMQNANTSYLYGASLLIAFAMANLCHALSFFYTLKHFPGGATSAGVMKALQAALVFVFTSLAFCGRLGGEEMCFTGLKFISLLIVVGGTYIYGRATEQSFVGRDSRDSYAKIDSGESESYGATENICGQVV